MFSPICLEPSIFFFVTELDRLILLTPQHQVSGHALTPKLDEELRRKKGWLHRSNMPSTVPDIFGVETTPKCEAKVPNFNIFHLFSLV